MTKTTAIRTGDMVMTSDKASTATRARFARWDGLSDIGKVLRVNGAKATVRLRIMVEQDFYRDVDVEVWTRELRVG